MSAASSPSSCAFVKSIQATPAWLVPMAEMQAGLAPLMMMMGGCFWLRQRLTDLPVALGSNATVIAGCGGMCWCLLHAWLFCMAYGGWGDRHAVMEAVHHVAQVGACMMCAPTVVRSMYCMQLDVLCYLLASSGSVEHCSASVANCVAE